MKILTESGGVNATRRHNRRSRIIIASSIIVIVVLAVATAMFVSANSRSPPILQLQGYNDQYAPPFNGPWSCGQAGNQVTSGWIVNMTAANTGSSTVTVSRLEIGNASYGGPIAFAGSGLNSTVVGPSFEVVIPPHENFFVRFALCQPIHTSDYLPINVQICKTFQVTLVSSAGNSSANQEALYSPC